MLNLFRAVCDLETGIVCNSFRVESYPIASSHGLVYFLVVLLGWIMGLIVPYLSNTLRPSQERLIIFVLIILLFIGINLGLLGLVALLELNIFHRLLLELIEKSSLFFFL